MFGGNNAFTIHIKHFSLLDLKFNKDPQLLGAAAKAEQRVKV
jgi:hypothetical protein